MLKKCIMAMMMLIVAIPVFGVSIELVYDDGSPSTGFRGGIYENIIYAVRFTPPSGEWQLVGIRYFITTPGYPAKVRVFDSSNDRPGDDLIPGFNITPQSTGWYNVDLSDGNILVSDEFYVGLEMLSLEPMENPGLGGDTYGNDRSWNYVMNQWLFNEHTTYFIRAVIDDGEAIEEESEASKGVVLCCEPIVRDVSTPITYFLPETDHVNVSVWDAAGRCAGVLLEEVQSAGDHAIEWNLLDSHGNILSPGVYFINLRTSTGHVSSRIILMN